MQSAVPDSHTPDLRQGMLSQQTLGSSECGPVDDEGAAFDVDGNDVASVLGFDPGPNLLVVDLVAARSDLISRVGSRLGRLGRHGHHLVSRSPERLLRYIVQDRMTASERPLDADRYRAVVVGAVRAAAPREELFAAADEGVLQTPVAVA